LSAVGTCPRLTIFAEIRLVVTKKCYFFLRGKLIRSSVISVCSISIILGCVAVVGLVWKFVFLERNNQIWLAKKKL
jgi:hypothetical protein